MNNPRPVDSLPLPEIYYEHQRGGYWFKNVRGGWIQGSETTIKRLLRQQGFNRECMNGELLSALEKGLIDIQTTHDIAYAGPLAGYPCGVFEFSKNRILITSGLKLILPQPGEFPILQKLLLGLLGETQIPYLLGWLKIGFAALRVSQYRPGQALVLAGPPGCGKSLLQKLITEIFGGRSAKPYRYMSGGSAFNAELFGAEHLMIEDEAASTDMRARRAFGAAIKQFTVNESQSWHGKGKTALPLEPIWRLSVTVNDEPENLLILPPLDESLADKIILLRADKKPMPMPTVTPSQRQVFWDALMSELPAFLHHLENWIIPDELQCERFGIRHFHHPELLQSLQMLSPEMKLLGLIDGVLFAAASLRFWHGPAEQLERLLRDSPFRDEAARLLSWSNATGTYLGRLAKAQPQRVVPKRASALREWTIYSARMTESPAEPGNLPSGCHCPMTP